MKITQDPFTSEDFLEDIWEVYTVKYDLPELHNILQTPRKLTPTQTQSFRGGGTIQSSFSDRKAPLNHWISACITEAILDIYGIDVLELTHIINWRITLMFHDLDTLKLD